MLRNASPMLKYKGVLVIALLVFTQFAWSQSDMTVKGTSPDLYLMHTVQPKETWFAIGRLYNSQPKDIATFSGVTMDKLSIGQELKVPLSAHNFSQDGKKNADEVFVPVYHIVQEKEWMYRISQNYNKLPIESLEKWNSVTNDQLQAGMKLIVGYLKVKTASSPLAANGLKKLIVPAATTVGTAAKPTETAVVKTEKPAETKPAETKTTETKPADTKTTETKVETHKEELKKEEPKKEDAKKDIGTPPPTTPVTPVSATEGNYSGYKGGYFKPTYNGSGKSTAGNAGIFRSTSGWKDGKYYALMNNVPVGTIVKITYNSTNKSVFAKVLGQLPDMRESVGLTLRLSDAAAAELGAEMGKFYVDVAY
ncbi:MULTISPECIES: LysM peptidoglycan-binding domain-containing protein [Niastella]|uniref:LysM peptidoglycan-binding domain-containing protein n=1 Tax=Niastella soli TaxID=2821487 RepID=A0ABS3YTS8_9BACT|nr:LysM peptidoglycan-binding domain-containing protein [Niastella soli]MBO9201249.1 LysM peptidoglycan-binding domain-containing protein [Niastella soli]